VNVAAEHSAVATLRARYLAYRERQPTGYLRDAARALGVSEAELLVASGGDRVTPLRLDDLESLLRDIARWGELRTMTRNDHAVIEQTGRYDNLEFFGQAMGQTVGSIDLRIFASRWAHAFGVVTEGRQGPRCSVQFFDRHGVNVHKVFTSEPTAFERVRDVWSAGPGPVELPAIEPVAAATERADADVDVAALRARWDALTDTHEFHAMIRELGVSRAQALRLAGPERARAVAPEALQAALEGAARNGETLMIFVGNRGLVQIYIGAIHRVVATQGWLNVLDRDFNLHVRDGAIRDAWVVSKPTRHGPVLSLECCAADGETAVQLFGKRTEAESTPAGIRRLFDSVIEAYAV
jgi:putative hemin transport protein